jgi:hypothetical protein
MGHGGLTDPRDRHNARLLVVSIGGAVVLLAGLLYTAGSYRLAHRGQVTDRFIKALERLGSEELYVRYGGIMALEQIVQDAPDHAARVLGVFIRTRAPQRRTDPNEAVPEGSTASRNATPPHQAQAAPLVELPDRPEEDLQAALTALARHNARRRVRQQQPIILNHLHLAGALFYGADLTDALLDGADLTGAQLTGANLTGAQLVKADLTGAQLDGADLIGAWLPGANLTRTRLDGAVLDGMLWSGDTEWPSAKFATQVQARSDEEEIHDPVGHLQAVFVVRR